MVKDPCFKIEFMDFSQRRREGFRQRPEFDNKRVLIADKKTIKIIAYYDVDVSQLDLSTLQDKSNDISASKAPRSKSPLIQKNQS